MLKERPFIVSNWKIFLDIFVPMGDNRTISKIRRVNDDYHTYT